MALGTFLISLISSYTSTHLLDALPVVPAFGVLAAIIFSGIIFDIVGVAATAANEVPFHAMASDRVAGAKEAIWIVRNAPSVATFCNDMIGDIAGTLSGAVGTGIAFALLRNFHYWNQGLVGTLLISLAAAAAVGGKALGKNVAIAKAGDIVHAVGRIIYAWEALTGLRITNFGNTVGRRVQGKKAAQRRFMK